MSQFDRIVMPAFGVLVGALLWLERRHPLRRPTQPARERLRVNAAIAVPAMLTMRAIVLPAVVAIARWGERRGIGAARAATRSPLARAALGLLLMDYTTYLWHRLNHAVPGLWRFHAVHHTDLDLDASTAARFHVGELVASVAARAVQVLVVGASPRGALVWEVAELVATEFHHSNLRLPVSIERPLACVFVTPRMHGIHHSIVERETSSNWSVVLSCWDRLHRTLRLDVPQAEIVIGVPAYRDPRHLGVLALLAMPFRQQRATWTLPSGEHPERLAGGDPRRLAD